MLVVDHADNEKSRFVLRHHGNLYVMRVTPEPLAFDKIDTVLFQIAPAFLRIELEIPTDIINI